MPEREVKGWAVVDDIGWVHEFNMDYDPLAEDWARCKECRIVPARVILEVEDD